MSVRRSVTWLGHSTALLEVGGVRLLTDPLLRGRLAHLTRRAPTVAAATVGPVDAILISHVHFDHLDRPTLKALGTGTPIVAPRGAARLLRGLGPVHELDVGEHVEIRGVRVTATPAVHATRRVTRLVPSLGYLVDGDLYFAGDTDRFDAMAGLGPLALALLPVWGYGPTLGPGHLDPRRAAEAAALLQARVAVPIHWGTYFPFPLGLRGHPMLRDPPVRFAAHAATVAPATEVVRLEPGGRLDLG